MANKNETVAEIASVTRVIASHKREIEELNFKLMTSKSEQKTAANVIIEQTNKVEKLEREIAELRECLQEAVDYQCGRGEKCEGCFFVEVNKRKECVAYKWRKALEGGHK